MSILSSTWFFVEDKIINLAENKKKRLGVLTRTDYLYMKKKFVFTLILVSSVSTWFFFEYKR